MTTGEYNTSVDEFADGVYRFILKNIKNVQFAQDIVQESFAKMWEKAGDIAYEKAKSYLFTTAYHTMIDFLRKERKNIDLEIRDESLGLTDGQYSDVKEVLEEALEKLPAIQKSVLLLRDYEGYSYKEIGDITGLNEPQVKVYIYRARIFLKKYIVKLENVV